MRELHSSACFCLASPPRSTDSLTASPSQFPCSHGRSRAQTGRSTATSNLHLHRITGQRSPRLHQSTQPSAQRRGRRLGDRYDLPRSSREPEEGGIDGSSPHLANSILQQQAKLAGQFCFSIPKIGQSVIPNSILSIEIILHYFVD